MGIRLEEPPMRELMVDKDGKVNPVWARWFVLLHKKTGGTEAALPVSLGGSGATSVVGALAVQTATTPVAGGSSSSSAVTQRKTFTLNSPSGLGDSAETICLWDTHFTDANYTATADYSNPTRGDISISNITAAGFTVTLTQTTDRPTGGTADCIGVHR